MWGGGGGLGVGDWGEFQFSCLFFYGGNISNILSRTVLKINCKFLGWGYNQQSHKE